MNGIDKLLIANRGEIARRVIRSARALGIRTVAVFSDADADAPHVRDADAAVRIGPPAPGESYLSIPAIIAAAQRTGADAIHPGYGFLAENAAFAEACAEAGLTFVGPSPAAIRLMGDKVAAKRAMVEAGVPTAPGYDGSVAEAATLAAEAQRLGFPLLVKALAGGGGRGMRRVDAGGDLATAVEGARQEAQGAFGNPAVFLEKLIAGARHIEIQVFADTHGTTVHLGERECSVQRRHQKIIEESPSPAVGAELRGRMGQAAVAAAKAIDYVGAGTVEFLLDDAGTFYFLEMNTRLQVEHPVTELVTGLDLVALQLRVAGGQRLGLTQDDVVMRGHAIEARVYAEDPYAGFLPQLGEVLAWWPAEGEGVRVDDGLRSGQTITPHYDAMVAKVIGYGDDRERARRRLRCAVRDSVLLGPGSNRSFLAQLLDDPAFVAGQIRTDTIDARMSDEPPARPQPDAAMWAIAAVLRSAASTSERGRDVPWHSAGDRRWPVTLRAAGETKTLQVIPGPPGGGARVSLGETSPQIEIDVLEVGDGRARLGVDGVHETVAFVHTAGGIALDRGGLAVTFEEPLVGAASDDDAGDGRVRAPIGGTIRRVDVEVGATVAAGDVLAIVEAMKMEHRVVTKGAGTVTEVKVTAGDQVAARQILVVVASTEQKEES